MGAHALIIRSATKVDAAALEAADDLVVVGRAGIGLDNVDVERGHRARRDGRQRARSRTSSRRPSRRWRCCWPRRATSPRRTPRLKDGKWERSKWEGVELHGKTLGVVGLGKIGALVAQRALAFGMRLIAYDPFISEERARHMGVEFVDLETLLGAERLHHDPPAEEQRDDEPVRTPSPWRRPSPACGSSTSRAAASSTRTTWPRRSATGTSRARRWTSSRRSPRPRRPSSISPRSSWCLTWARPPSRPRTRPGSTIAEQVALALAGDFVPYARQRLGRRGLQRRCSPFMGLAELLGSIHRRTARRQARGPRGRLPGRVGRRGDQDPDPLRAEGSARAPPATTVSPS